MAKNILKGVKSKSILQVKPFFIVRFYFQKHIFSFLRKLCEKIQPMVVCIYLNGTKNTDTTKDDDNNTAGSAPDNAKQFY